METKGLSNPLIAVCIISNMSMVGIAYQNNHDLDQPKIVNLLVTSFSSTLRGWWDSYLAEESRDSIRHAVKGEGTQRWKRKHSYIVII